MILTSVRLPNFAPSQTRARTMRATASTPIVRCDFSQGAKVRVTAPITVHHVGKFKQGLDLKGMEGIVQGDARQHSTGMELSATLPWKVQFEAKAPDGKAVKVLAHFVSSFSCYLWFPLLRVPYSHSFNFSYVSSIQFRKLRSSKLFNKIKRWMTVVIVYSFFVFFLFQIKSNREIESSCVRESAFLCILYFNFINFNDEPIYSFAQRK